MATYYWAAPSVAAFNSANWATSDGGASGFGPPGSGDIAIFKGDTNSNKNCTLTADFTIASLDMRNNYAGSFRTDGVSHSFTVTGLCAFGCSAAGEIKLGYGTTWYIGGHLYTNQVLGDFLPLTSTVRLTGSNNTILQGSSLPDAFYTLQVDKTSTGGIQLQGNLDCVSLNILDGDFDLNENDATVASHFRVHSGATWTQSTTSTITLDGTQASANTFTYDEVDPIIMNRTASGGILQAGPLAARSLTMNDGIWQTAGYDVDVSGDVILDCDTVNSTGGGGTWTIGGNFDWKDVGTWEPNNNTLFDMTGSNKYLLGTDIKNLPNLTVTGSTYLHASTSNSIDVIGDTVIDGTLTIASGLKLRVGGTTGNLYVNTTGTITGDGSVYFITMRSGYGLILTGGYTYDISTVFFNPRVGCYIPPGTYSQSVKIHGDVSTSTWQPITGTYTFEGNLQISAIPAASEPSAHSRLNVDNRYAQPVFIIEGKLILQPAENVGSTAWDGFLYIYNNHATLDIDWIFSDNVNALHLNPFYWYAGSGTLEFTGSNNHTLDLYNETIEAIVIDKSGGTLTLDYDINPASFTLTLGTFDADIYDVDIAGTGDITLVDGTIHMGSGTWTCHGHVDLSLVTATNFNRDTAKLVMGGTSKTIKSVSTSLDDGPYSFEVSTGAVISQLTNRLIIYNGTCVINGTFNASVGFWIYGTCQLTMGPSSSLVGVYLVLYDNFNNGGLYSYTSGTINCTNVHFRAQSTTAAEIPAGVYNANVKWDTVVGHNYITLASGTHTINGSLYVDTIWSTYNNYIRNNINNPNIIISQQLSYSNTGNATYWTKGNGLITFTGSSYIGTLPIIGTLDAIEIDSSGTQILISNLDCQSLLIDGGIFSTDGYNVTINDFFRMNNGTYCYAGTGSVWDVGGDWDLQAIGAVNRFYGETSEIKLTGTGNLEVSGSNWYNAFHKLTVSGTYLIPSTSGDVIINEGTNSWLKITNGGTLTLAAGEHLYISNTVGTNVYIESGGELAIGSGGYVQMMAPASGYGIQQNLGQITGAGEFQFRDFAADNPIAPGIYPNVSCYAKNVNSTTQFDSGTFTINGNLKSYSEGSGNHILDIGTDSPIVNVSGDIIMSTSSTGTANITRAGATTDWDIGGDWLLTGAAAKTYIKGAAGASITANGAGTQNLNFSAGDIEDFIVDKASGTAFLAGTMNTETLTGTSGNFDAVTYAVTVGDVDWNSNTLDLGSGVWTCSGNFDADVTGVTLTQTSTGSILFTGVSKVLKPRYTSTLYNVTINTGASYTFSVTNDGIFAWFAGTTGLTLNGTLKIQASDALGTRCPINFGASGILGGDGNGALWMRGYNANDGIKIFPGTAEFNIESFEINHQADDTDLLPVAGTYTATIQINIYNPTASDKTFKFGPGEYTFDTPITRLYTWSTGDIIIGNSTNNPVITFNGSIIQLHNSTGVGIWNKGTGTITLAGDATTYSLDADIGEFETTEVTGDYNMVADFDCVALTINGIGPTFDAGTYDVTISGDFDLASGNLYGGTGSIWTISGNADFLSGGFFTRETSKFIFNGSGVTVTGGYTNTYMGKVEFATAFNGNLDYMMLCMSDVVINGTVNVLGPGTGADGGLMAYYSADVTLGASANYSGATGFLNMKNSWATLTIPGGAIFAPDQLRVHNGYAGLVIPARDYAASGVDFQNAGGHLANEACPFQPGTTKFVNAVFWNAATNDVSIILPIGANFHVTGNLDVYETSTGKLNWSSTGNLYMSSSGDHSANTNDIYVGPFTIAKNSSVTLTSNLTAENLTLETGNFDTDDFDVTLTDFFQQDSGTICKAGTGTWDVGGNWDTVAATASGSFLAEDGEIKLTGSGTLETYCFDWTNAFHKLTVSGTYTMPSSSNQAVVYQGSPGGWLKIPNGGKLTLDATSPNNFVLRGTSDLIVESGGELAINSGAWLYMYEPSDTYGIPTNDGSITGAGELSIRQFDITNPFDNGIYPNIRLHSTIASTVRFSAGTYTINGYLNVDAEGSGTVTADMSTNAPSVYIGGNVTLQGTAVATITRASVTNNWNIGEDFIVSGAGAHVYIKGAAGASITANGTGTQNLNFSAGDIEDFIINKSSGTAFLTGLLVTDSFLAISGTLDFNGQTLETIGDFTINSANSTGFSVVSNADAMNAADITVGNDFYVSNVTFNATDTWYLDVQGSNALAFDVGVRYSDADAGTTIDATHYSNRDLGVNYNWAFGGHASIQSTTFYCFPWTRLTNRSRRGFNRR